MNSLSSVARRVVAVQRPLTRRPPPPPPPPSVDGERDPPAPASRSRDPPNRPSAAQLHNEMRGARDCKSARCGVDAGCRREPDGSFICVCTHDFSLPRDDGSCPRNVISNSTYRDDPDGFHGNVSSWNQTIWKDFDKGSTHYVTTLAWSAIVLVASLISAYALAIAVRRRDATSSRAGRGSLCCVPGVVHRTPHTRGECMVTNPMYSPAGFAQSSDGFEGSLILLREWIELDDDAIGEGFFGKVYRGRLKRNGERSDFSYINLDDDDELVAVKKLKPVSASVLNSLNDELIREATTVASFSHANILAFKGVVFNEGNMAPWIVFEFMELGDLADLLRRMKIEDTASPKKRIPSRRFTEGDLVSMAEQIARGMSYLSSRQYIHRDLACRNCLVTERPTFTSQPEFVVKISDFGMSRNLDTSSYYQMQGSRLLPVRWMAPEAVLYGKFCLESDVWSYGVVLWEIFTFGAIPYCGCSNEQVVDLIRNGNILEPPDAAPAFIKEIMTQDCWREQPRKRRSFSDICDKFKAHLSAQSELRANPGHCPALYLDVLPDSL